MSDTMYAIPCELRKKLLRLLRAHEEYELKHQLMMECEAIPPVAPVTVDLSGVQRYRIEDDEAYNCSFGPWVKFSDLAHLLAIGGQDSRKERYRVALVDIANYASPLLDLFAKECGRIAREALAPAKGEE